MRTKKTPLMIETERLALSQETAALALASGCTEDEAAKKIGAASRTIKTWLETDHTFTHRIHQIRSSISQRVNASLVDKMQTAIATLEDLCRDSRNDATRLAAAKLILEGCSPLGTAENTGKSRGQRGIEVGVRNRRK